MAPDRNDHTPEDDLEHGVLSDSGNLETTSIGILSGATEQFSVVLPGVDDDVDDDDVIDDELAIEGFEPALLSLSGPTDGDVTDDRYVQDHPRETSEIETIEAELDDVEMEPAQLEASADLIAEAVAPEFAEDLDEPVTSDGDDTAISNAPVAQDGAGVTEVHDAGTARSEDHSPHVAAFDEHRHNQEDDRMSATAASGTHPVEAPDQDEIAESFVDDVSSDDEEETAVVDADDHHAAVAPSPAQPVSGSVPTTRREAHHPDSHDRAERAHAVERVQTRNEVTLASKRIGEFEPDRESSDLLTADRLLDPTQIVRPEPEGAWQHFVYSLSGRRINLGDGKRARSRKELNRRIALPLDGDARFVPVLSRKGGVGKTTITTLLGMALADARDDRVIAIDANPDRGTLAERIAKTNGKTVRDLVRMRGDVTGYKDVSSVVARDETRLDVLASDSDPRVSEALSDRDYHDVATLAAHYYSIVLTDTGTGIVHSVMGATLEVADSMVIVAGLSVDEAKLASETLTWLETNGYQEQVRNAVVVLNTSRPGAPLVRRDELETHFRTRVRSVVSMPYDPMIAAGSAISFAHLQPATRLAARELAAAVVEGLRALAPAA